MRQGPVTRPAYRLMVLARDGTIAERYRGSLLYLLRMADKANHSAGRWAKGRRWIELNVEPAIGAGWRRVNGRGSRFTRLW